MAPAARMSLMATLFRTGAGAGAGAHCNPAQGGLRRYPAASLDSPTEAVMTISSLLSGYLEQRGARFDICAHPRSRTSVQTARVAHVPLHQIAKPVIVEDDAGCVMAIVPADRVVKLGQLARLLERKHLHLADEDRIAELFIDCDRGAVPGLGMAWGVETIFDDELEANAVVYLEGGDHECLLRLSHAEFHALVRGARHGQFSVVPAH